MQRIGGFQENSNDQPGGRREFATTNLQEVAFPSISRREIWGSSYLRRRVNLHMRAQEDIQVRWWSLEARLAERFGKKPDLEGILFLIGIQELGQIREKFTKEQKQDLMHVAVCTLLEPSGYYVKEGTDREGWPQFRQLKALPVFEGSQQEDFLKDHILLYFQQNDFID